MPDRPLRPYMAFSRAAGPEEGAILIWAHTARQAKRVAAPELFDLTDDFLDLAVRRLRDVAWLDEYRKQDVPHVGDPPCCPRCERWGEGHQPVTEGSCESCFDPHDDELPAEVPA